MEYQTYPEYNDSSNNWLGKTPSHWETTKIKRKFRIVNGSTPKSSESQYWDGDIIWVTPADFSSNVQGYITKTRRKITLEGLKSCGTSLVPIESIVVTIRAPIGGIAQARSEVCTNQGCKSLVVDTTNIFERFVYYVLVVSEKQLNALGLGTTFMELTKDALGYYPFALPHYEEQQKIANFLDYKTQQIDQLIEKKKALIEKLSEQRIAVITQAVTKGIDKDAKMKPSGVDWLGDVPEHWDINRLKFSVNLINLKIEAKESDLPYMGMENIESFTAKKIYDEENPPLSEGVGSYFKQGDVLFGKLRPYLAKAYLSDFEGFCSAELLVLEGEKYLPEYLVHLVLSDWFIELVNSSTYGAKMPRASWDYIGNMICPVPSEAEQKVIVEHICNQIEKIEKMKLANQNIIKKLEEYRTSLITSAVTGKIDVRDFEIPVT